MTPHGSSDNPPPRATGALRAVRVWDLPTRLFHWALAIGVTASFISAQIGGNAMVWHVWLGLMSLALLAFRLVWGVIGGRWSRFSSLRCAPTSVMRYLRGQSGVADQFEVGHNPLGAWSVLAMLGLLSGQVVTGLLADDEIGNVGPLSQYVSTETASKATFLHADVGQWVLVALVVLHVAAIAFYTLRRHKPLIGPMITGDKQLQADVPASRDSTGTRVLAAVVFAAGAALSWWIGSLA